MFLFRWRQLKDVACNKMDNRDIGSRLCNSMPKVGRDLAEVLPPLLWSVGAVGLAAFTLAGLGIWYTFELAFVEASQSAPATGVEDSVRCKLVLLNITNAISSYP